MSWDPDELPDVESMSDIPGSALGTVRDESVNESLRDEPEVFGSVGNNTQEFQEHSPLHNSARSTSSEEEQVVLQDGQVPYTEFPFKAFLRANIVLKKAFSCGFSFKKVLLVQCFSFN